MIAICKVVETWHIPPPTVSTIFLSSIDSAYLYPFSSVLSPTISLNENSSPGFNITLLIALDAINKFCTLLVSLRSKLVNAVDIILLI